MKQISSFLLFALTCVNAYTCEVCAVYSPESTQNDAEHRWTVNLFQRYSELDTVIDGSRETPARGEQIESYLTQASIAVRAGEKLHLQLSVPYLHRDFTKLEDGHLRSGSESGFGDVSILGKFRAFENSGDEGIFAVTLMAGIKAPTGDTDQLRSDGHHDTGVEDKDHHALSGAIHHAASAEAGHDLTLGSGSWDVLTGADLYCRQGALYLGLQGQYYFRDEGKTARS